MLPWVPGGRAAFLKLISRVPRPQAAAASTPSPSPKPLPAGAAVLQSMVASRADHAQVLSLWSSYAERSEGDLLADSAFNGVAAAALKAACASKDWAQAQAVLAAVDAHPNKAAAPYVAFAVGLCAANRFKAALQVIQRMNAHGLHSDFVYRPLFEHAAESRNPELVLKFLRTVLDRHARSTVPLPSPVPAINSALAWLLRSMESPWQPTPPATEALAPAEGSDGAPSSAPAHVATTPPWDPAAKAVKQREAAADQVLALMAECKARPNCATVQLLLDPRWCSTLDRLDFFVRTISPALPTPPAAAVAAAVASSGPGSGSALASRSGARSVGGGGGVGVQAWTDAIAAAVVKAALRLHPPYAASFLNRVRYPPERVHLPSALRNAKLLARQTVAHAKSAKDSNKAKTEGKDADKGKSAASVGSVRLVLPKSSMLALHALPPRPVSTITTPSRLARKHFAQRLDTRAQEGRDLGASVYNTLIQGLCALGQLDTALFAWADAQSHWLFPDERSHLALMRAAGATGTDSALLWQVWNSLPGTVPLSAAASASAPAVSATSAPGYRAIELWGPLRVPTFIPTHVGLDRWLHTLMVSAAKLRGPQHMARVLDVFLSLVPQLNRMGSRAHVVPAAVSRSFTGAVSESVSRSASGSVSDSSSGGESGTQSAPGSPASSSGSARVLSRLCTAYLRSLAQEHEFAAVHRSLDTMRQGGLPLSENNYVAVIHQISRPGDAKHAFALLRAMVADRIAPTDKTARALLAMSARTHGIHTTASATSAPVSTSASTSGPAAADISAAVSTRSRGRGSLAPPSSLGSARSRVITSSLSASLLHALDEPAQELFGPIALDNAVDEAFASQAAGSAVTEGSHAAASPRDSPVSDLSASLSFSHTERLQQLLRSETSQTKANAKAKEKDGGFNYGSGDPIDEIQTVLAQASPEHLRESAVRVLLAEINARLTGGLDSAIAAIRLF